MDTLKSYRNEIDQIDSEILKLFSNRKAIVKKIGDYKRENRIEPLDTVRWSEVVSNLKKQALSLGLDVAEIEEIYEIIHKYAIKMQ